MRVDYDPEGTHLVIYLAEGLGPSEDGVIVDRDEGSIHLEFNRHGQLIGIVVHGQIDKLIPSEFLADFANPS